MTFTVASLGVLPGGSESQALGASADGSVIVGQSDTGSSGGYPIAFRWTSVGGMVSLGTFPGGVGSVALACSADGSVVVGFAYRGSGPVGAFKWTSGGGMVDLGNLGTGDTSVALCISADGLTIGGQSAITPGSNPHPFSWTSGGGMVDLGLYSANVAGAANGMSSDGSIFAGGSSDGGDVPWMWNGSLSGIPLPSPYTAGQVNALSANGQAAAATVSVFPNNLPYYWSQGGGAALIPLLAGQSFGVGSGISGDGLTVVGRCGPSPTDPDQLPYIWTSGAGTVELPLLVGSSYGSAYQISSDASTIVGSNIISGVEVAAYWSSPLATGTLTIADMWFASTPGFVDLTQVSNRRLFIAVNGGAQNLGTDGSAPFAVAPQVFLTRQGSAPAASFAANNGRGGAFAISGGTLSNGATNPPGTSTTTTTTVSGGGSFRQGILGSYLDGNLYTFNPLTLTDNGTRRKWVRRWRGLPTITNKATRFSYLQVIMQTGAGMTPSANPQVVLRWSDDGGHTWSQERYALVGKLGVTSTSIKFNRLGSTRRFAGSDRIFELSSTDPFTVAIIDAEVETSP